MIVTLLVVIFGVIAAMVGLAYYKKKTDTKRIAPSPTREESPFARPVSVNSWVGEPLEQTIAHNQSSLESGIVNDTWVEEEHMNSYDSFDRSYPEDSRMSTITEESSVARSSRMMARENIRVGTSSPSVRGNLTVESSRPSVRDGIADGSSNPSITFSRAPTSLSMGSSKITGSSTTLTRENSMAESNKMMGSTNTLMRESSMALSTNPSIRVNSPTESIDPSIRENSMADLSILSLREESMVSPSVQSMEASNPSIDQISMADPIDQLIRGSGFRRPTIQPLQQQNGWFRATEGLRRQALIQSTLRPAAQAPTMGYSSQIGGVQAGYAFNNRVAPAPPIQDNLYGIQDQTAPPNQQELYGMPLASSIPLTLPKGAGQSNAYAQYVSAITGGMSTNIPSASSGRGSPSGRSSTMSSHDDNTMPPIE